MNHVCGLILVTKSAMVLQIESLRIGTKIKAFNALQTSLSLHSAAVRLQFRHEISVLTVTVFNVASLMQRLVPESSLF